MIDFRGYKPLELIRDVAKHFEEMKTEIRLWAKIEILVVNGTDKISIGYSNLTSDEFPRKVWELSNMADEHQKTMQKLGEIARTLTFGLEVKKDTA